MRIVWGIRKKQGNHRPVFWYEIEYTPEEAALNPLPGRVETAAPVPVALFAKDGQDREPEGEALRPSHLDGRDDLPLLELHGGKGRRFAVLPWRPDGNVFEEQLAQAVESLRQSLETALLAAVDSGEVRIEREARMSEDAARKLAGYVARSKLLRP